jgi:SAM-dependent methyltransferase
MTNPRPQQQEAPAGEAEAQVRRMNWGCGEHPDPGWINSDIKDGPGIDISCDIRDGFPLANNSLDYIVSHHALPEIPYGEVVGALNELRRVLRPGGVLRLGLPDLVRGVKAYLDNDRDYFIVPDRDAATIGGKLVAQVVWYGWSRTPFTEDFAEEVLRKAGFREVYACSYRETRSEYPEIVACDGRERESLFVEAVK